LSKQTGANHSDRDRRARQADRLARILSVLRLIQSRGQWNAKAIARELEVTERTVYRDLQALEFAGVPYYFDEDAQSYRVRSDYRFPGSGWHAQDECWTGWLGWHVPESSKGVLVDVSA
jgi:hypothetical protein